MKLSEEQNELLAVLPNVEIINTLRDSQKLVLAQIVLMYGTDYATENGYVYMTNQKLMDETEIRSEKTIIASVRKLVQVGLITTKRGKRQSASEYSLTSNYFELSSENYSNTVKNYSNNFKNYSINYSETFDVMGIIESMQQEINELKKQVEELKNTVKNTVKQENYSIKTENYSNEVKNYSTDTDTEEEIEKEKKEKINKKEKVSVETVSEPRNGNGVNTPLNEVTAKGNTVTVSEETSKGTVKNFGLHTLQELMELEGISEASEDTLTSSERSDKENTKASNDTLTSSVGTQHTSKVNTFNKVKDSQSTVDEVNLHNVGSVSEKQEISAPAPAANFNYDFYLNQFEHWAKNGIAAFNIDRFTQTVKPFVDSGEIKIERYQRDVARLQRYA